MFTAPIQWLTDNPVLVYNIVVLATPVLAGLGLYLLARDLTGERDASLIGALAFAFSPYRVAQMTHLQTLTCGWMPIALWALHRYCRNGLRTSLTVFTAAFLLQSLSNGYYFYALSIVSAMVGLHGLKAVGNRWRHCLAGLVIAGLVILAVLSPVLAAYYRVRTTQGLFRSHRDMVNLSADLLSYVSVSPELRIWRHILPAEWKEGTLFPGLLAATMALTASLAVHRSKTSPVSAIDLSRTASIGLYVFVAVSALILSLGPEPAAWNGYRLPTGPYAWLVAIVPGMDGLRVPARFGALVQLSIAVLAAFGLAILFAKLRPTARRSAALMCGAFVLLEGYGGPIRSDEIPSAEMRRDVAAYQYLKAQPKGVLLELPAGIFTAELQYVYQTLEHGHQIINGYSGYGTALHELASGPAFREVDSVDGALAMLRTIGVRYVTIHEQLYPDSTLVTALRKEIRTSHDVATTVTVGPVEIIELHSARNLAQLASPLGEAVDMKGVKVTTSQNDGLASRMLDGDLSTRWFTGVPQSGGEVVEITFDRPKQLSHLRLDLQRRSFGDFPRHLIVESSLDGQTFSRLFEGDVLTSLGLSLVERPNEPAIEIPLPRHSGRVLRLRQTGRTPRNWFWSIHELRLWEVANDK